MWALLGVWAVQQTIDNNNASLAVPDLQVNYTYGRVVSRYLQLMLAIVSIVLYLPASI